MMTPLLLAAKLSELAAELLVQPIAYAIVLGAIALLFLLPRSSPLNRGIGGVLAAISGGAFVAAAIRMTHDAPSKELIEWIVFGLLASVTVGSAVAMISSRSAVYSAIWFALTLLGTGGLFLYQGAQFLGVATVVVYAGAIVVTFLFVIMLAQPDGHAAYDRISWGSFAKPAAALVGALLLGSVVYALQGLAVGGLREQVAEAIEEVVEKDTEFPLRGAQIVSARRGAQREQLSLLVTSDVREVKPEQLAALSAVLTPRLNALAKPDEAKVEAYQLNIGGLSTTQDVLAQEHMAHLGGFLFSRHLMAIEVGATLLLAALVGAVAMLSQSAQVRREGEAHV